jgi:hypothetical protein
VLTEQATDEEILRCAAKAEAPPERPNIFEHPKDATIVSSHPPFRRLTSELPKLSHFNELEPQSKQIIFTCAKCKFTPIILQALLNFDTI